MWCDMGWGWRWRAREGLHFSQSKNARLLNFRWHFCFYDNLSLIDISCKNIHKYFRWTLVAVEQEYQHLNHADNKKWNFYISFESAQVREKEHITMFQHLHLQVSCMGLCVRCLKSFFQNLRLAFFNWTGRSVSAFRFRRLHLGAVF